MSTTTTFTFRETRELVREVRDDLAPIAARVAEGEKLLRSLAARKDLGVAFEKSVQADLQSQQRLKASVARAYRLLDDIGDNLYAIEHGRRRASHPIAGGRRTDIPFEDEPTRRTLH